MGLNQKVSLILQAEDKGQVAFASFLRGVTGLGSGAAKTTALLKQQMQVSNDLAVAQQRLAIADQQLIDSNSRIALSQAKKTLATKEYTEAVVQQRRVMAALAEVNAASDLRIANTRAKIASATTLLSQKQQTAQFIAPQNVNVARERQANAELSRRLLQAQIAKDNSVSVTLVQQAGQELAASQVANQSLTAQMALQQRLAQRVGITTEEILALSRAEQTMASAVKGTDAALLGQESANRGVIEQQKLIASLNATVTRTLAEQTTATELATKKDLAAAEAKVKLAASTIAVGDAYTYQQGKVVAAVVAENKVANLKAEQKVLSPTFNAGQSLNKLVTLGAGATAVTALVAGYEASKKALDFTSIEAQVAAQTDTPLAAVQQIGTAQLAYTKLGQSQYSQTQLLQGAVIPLSLQLSKSVVAEIVPEMAKASAIVHAPDLSSISRAVIAETGFLGGGKNTSAAVIRGFLNTDVLAENRTGAGPGATIAAIPGLLTGINQSGMPPNTIGLNQALGLQTELVNATGTAPRNAATWIGQMIKAAVTRPLPQATALATKLGFAQDFGIKGFRASGNNIYAYLQKLSDDMAGPNKGAIAQVLFGGGVASGGVIAAKAFLNLTAGSNLTRAAQFTDMFAKSQGTISTDTNTLLEGQKQRQVGLLNEFNGDLITLGTTINQTLVPALLTVGATVVKVLTDVLNNGKPTPDNPAGGSFWDTFVAYFTPGGKNSITADPSGTRARNAAATGQSDSGLIPAMGHFIQRVIDTGGGPTGFTLSDFGFGSHDLKVKIPPANHPTSTITPAGTYSASWYAEMGIPLGPNNQVGYPPGQPAGHSAPFTIGPNGEHVFASGTRIGQTVHAQAANPSNFLSPNPYIQSLRANAMQQNSANEAMNKAFLAVQNSVPDTAKFRKDYKNYQNVISGIAAGTDNTSNATLAKMRDKLFAELGKPSVEFGLGPSAKSLIAGDAYTIQAGYMKTVFTRQLNAANVELSNAQARQSALAQSNASLAMQDAAAVKVYTKQLALIAVEESTGQLKKQDAKTARLVAKTTERTTFGNNLAGPLAEAQAGLSLAQATGVGITGAEKAVGKILRQQAADGVIGPKALALALYQLHQTAPGTQTPGPQLIRPNAAVDTLTVGFMASASRISQIHQASAQDRALANAEATIQTLRHALSIAEQQLAEDRKGTNYLRSIDNKTPKQGRSDSSTNRATGGIGALIGQSSAGSIRFPW